jgi:hypothetical protein
VLFSTLKASNPNVCSAGRLFSGARDGPERNPGGRARMLRRFPEPKCKGLHLKYGILRTVSPGGRHGDPSPLVWTVHPWDEKRTFTLKPLRWSSEVTCARDVAYREFRIRKLASRKTEKHPIVVKADHIASIDHVWSSGAPLIAALQTSTQS